MSGGGFYVTAGPQLVDNRLDGHVVDDAWVVLDHSEPSEEVGWLFEGVDEVLTNRYNAVGESGRDIIDPFDDPEQSLRAEVEAVGVELAVVSSLELPELSSSGCTEGLCALLWGHVAISRAQAERVGEVDGVVVGVVVGVAGDGCAGGPG